jgi:hypothetical protein
MWQKINNFVDKNTILSAFLITAFFLLLLTAVGLPTMQGTMELKIGMPILTAYYHSICHAKESRSEDFRISVLIDGPFWVHRLLYHMHVSNYGRRLCIIDSIMAVVCKSVATHNYVTERS